MIENDKLVKLSLASCGLSEKSCEYFKDLLTKNKHLKILDLGFNKMTEPLNICPNRIGNIGVKLICEGLMNNNSLIKLNVNHNHIYQDGIKDLDKLLDHNKKLVSLDCEQMGIPLNELNKESIKMKVKVNYRLLDQEQIKVVNQYLNPAYLKEILS